METIQELEVGGATYSIGKLDAFAQLHVARRIAPIQIAMGVSAAMLTQAKSDAEKADDSMLSLMGPAVDVVSKMSDADVNYVIHACLGVAKRKSGEKWARVTVNGQLMFNDIDMAVMMRVTVATIMGNLDGFFPVLPGATQ